MEQELQVGDRRYRFQSLMALDVGGDVATLPYSLKVLLENLAPHANGASLVSQPAVGIALARATRPTSDRRLSSLGTDRLYAVLCAR